MNRLILLLMLLTGYTSVEAYTITRFDQNWCISSFPSSYVPGTIVFEETSAGEIGRNQDNRTFFITAPSGFQFNTTAGTYSITGLSGNDITAISISAVTTARITARVTVSNTAQIDLNTITINFQIRAITSGSSGILYRSGGGLKINGSKLNPAASTSFGNLSAGTIMSFTSCTAAHTTTTVIPQAVINAEILQVQVDVVGNCNVFNLTSLDFDTDGGNGTGSISPATNISAARVYYTGSSNSFAPVGLFGSITSPNGAFSINGSQALADGANYFWLVYDVPTNAVPGEILDAACNSVTISGGVGVQIPSTQNPAGSRTISAIDQFFSLGDGNWSNTSNWSLTDGGASCSCTPTAAGNAFINTGHTVTLDNTSTITYLTIRDGATLNDNGSSSLTINNNLDIQGSGKLNSTSPVSVSGNLNTSGTGANTTTSSFSISGNTIIGNGTSLSSTSAADHISMSGNLMLSGTISSGTNGANIRLDGVITQVISGTGTISGSGQLELSTNAKIIATGSSITVSPNIAITGAITITNNGTVTTAGSITGSIAGSTWVNAANSTLNIAGALLTTGTLTATANPNTVNYNHIGNQAIKTTTYNHLNLSGSGNKTFAGTTTIDYDLNIYEDAIAVIGTNIVSGSGGLTMSGNAELTIARIAVTVPELTGTYTLTGGTIHCNPTTNGIQTLRGVAYYNLRLNGSPSNPRFNMSSVEDIAGDFTVQNRSVITNSGEITVGGNFVFSTSGTSTLGANDLTVNGTTTLSAGTLNLNSRYFTSSGLTLGGTTLNASNATIELTNGGGWANNGGTFTNTNSSVLFTGTSNQTIGGSVATTFNNITLDNSGSGPNYTVGATIQVNGTLTYNNGQADLGGNTLTLGSSTGARGTLAYTNGWFYNGTFRRWYSNATVSNGDAAALFPIGTSSYQRLIYVNAPSSAPTTGGTMSLSHTGTSGSSTVSFTDGLTDIDNRFNAFWTIATANGLAGGTWNITTFGEGLHNLSAISVLRLTNAAGVSGTAVTPAGSLNNPEIGRSGITFAQLANNFYWGYSQTALPVEIVSFTSEIKNRSVELKWSTASEINSSHFTLYRSSTNQNYEMLGTVASHGNSSVFNYYNFIDDQPSQGINYYRLTETDIDGKEVQVGLTTAQIKSRNMPQLVSNPVFTNLEIEMSGMQNSLITILIYDESGRLVYSDSKSAGEASERLQIDCSGMHSGIYVISASDGQQYFRERFLKL